MSNTLPLTVQDDIEAKERNIKKQTKYCSSRRMRLLTIVMFAFLSTLALIRYSGVTYDANSPVMMEDQVVEVNPQLTLKQELLREIEIHPLIVFSKTYCPYSQRAKKTLNSYNLKPFKVIEVDLRDDDYQVKMALKEISGRDTFPNIFFHGKTIGGSDDLEELEQSGELKKILAESHLLENKT